MAMRARACEVRKPRISVYDMCKAGHLVTFDIDEDGVDRSHAVHKGIGEITPFTLRKRVWEMDVEVVPPQEAQNINKSLEARKKKGVGGEVRTGAALNPFGGPATGL